MNHVGPQGWIPRIAFKTLESFVGLASLRRGQFFQ